MGTENVNTWHPKGLRMDWKVIFMSRPDAIHELYETCKNINSDETAELLINARDDDERRFIRAVTDCILQQKQRKVVAEKRF